jgi:hypothetical protein
VPYLLTERTIILDKYKKYSRNTYMPVRTTGGVFDEQVLTGSLAHYVVCGADFSGAMNSYGQPVPFSAAEIIFTKISEGAYINIMNPNEDNLSFALEAGRSVWDEISLTTMIQSLGNDVGTDHVDCSVCTVKRVPYIWGCGSGAESFLDLTDTPDSYAGFAGYVVTVNPAEDGLIFTPASAGANAFSFVASPSQPTITAVGSETLTLIAGTNMVITLDNTLKTATFDATGSGDNDFIPVPGGTALSISEKYFVTSAGTVTLPSLTGANTPGQSVTITKVIGITVLVDVGNPSDLIATDLGTTDQIEFDATQELVFIVSDMNTWNLQIGSLS